MHQVKQFQYNFVPGSCQGVCGENGWDFTSGDLKSKIESQIGRGNGKGLDWSFQTLK